jgi:hypothetical protein
MTKKGLIKLTFKPHIFIKDYIKKKNILEIKKIVSKKKYRR